MNGVEYLNKIKYQRNLEENILNKINMYERNGEVEEANTWRAIRYYFLQGCDKVNNDDKES